MANEQNLIKNSERTPSERRENAKKAGVASGKARRKKANLKKAFETILQADVASPNVKKQLEDLGFDTTNEMALAMVMMQKAMKGNVRAFEQISKLTTTDTKDSLDKREQKERIEALKLGNEKRRKEIRTSEVDVKDDGFIKSLEGVVEETWLD
ncbi:stress-induced protein [Streptococcus mitis]|uniref:stress-induced protein n=1 Tax=Streptococcus mitis TaxID=28037 RepID=UPI001C4E5A90|nr:stress-induced protein [Streptococcus phage MismyG]